MHLEVDMLTKCANPSCSTPLVYLREGKIFMLEYPSGPQPVLDKAQASVKPSARVEHFWLCGPCSAGMTLVHDCKDGFLVVRKNHRAAKAAC